MSARWCSARTNASAANVTLSEATMACLDNETATAYLRGDLEPDEAARWAAHLAECEACRLLVQEVSALIDSVRQDLMLSYSQPISVNWRQAEQVMRGREPRGWRVPRVAFFPPRFIGASLTVAAVM